MARNNTLTIIVVLTADGRAANLVSKYRPPCLVVVASTNEQVRTGGRQGWDHMSSSGFGRRRQGSTHCCRLRHVSAALSYQTESPVCPLLLGRVGC